MSRVVTVSVLFTDLVGSTALLSRVGPGAAEALRGEHFALLRAAINNAEGREVKNVGDGLMVVFDSAAAAVDCAVQMQQRLEVRNRRSEHELSVRLGVAMGDADHDGEDYFGPPVVEAARLCAKAGGGQILCSEMCRAMVGARGRHRFTEVGVVELKGFPAPVKVYEVAWEPAAGGKPALPLPPALAGVPPAGYVGRERERGLLTGLFEPVWEGGSRLALLSGEAGIGKTRLATLVALGAYARGSPVLFGRCEEGLAVPYGPWVEALRHWVVTADEETLGAHVAAHGGELSRLLPELARRMPDSPAPTATDPETERYLLFGAVRGALQQLAGDAAVVVVLDDLHWADMGSLLLLRHLAGQGALPRGLIIATYRSSELGREHPLTAVLADLRRQEGIERVALTGLHDAEVVELIQGAAGHDLDAEGLALASEIVRETDGNPFFVTEMLRHLRDSGEIVQDQQGRWRPAASIREVGLPESVREVVARRVERLDPEAASALRAAAVIGQEFELALLARVTERSEDRLLDLLEAAVAAAVITESAEHPGRFAFAHGLIRHTLYEDLGATRRARTHRRVAEALEESGADRGDRVGELAHHWTLATEAADPGKAIEYARLAAQRSLARLAPDAAVEWYEKALALLDGHPQPDHVLRCELLVGLGEALRQGGRGFRRTLLDATRLALSLGDGAAAARAALANTRGSTSAYGMIDEQRIELLDAVLRHVQSGQIALRARLMSLLALELVFDPDYRRRRSLSDEALELARQSGDDRALAQVLRDRAYTIWAPGTVDTRRSDGDQLLELAEQLDDPVLRYWAQHHLADASAESADIGPAREALRRARAIAEQLRQPSLLWHAMARDACLALLTSSPAEAEAVVMRAWAIGTDSGQPDAHGVGEAQTTLVRWMQARCDEAASIMDRLAREVPRIANFHAARGLALLDGGRTEDARRVLEEARGRDLERIPHDSFRIETLALYGRVAVGVNDSGAAAALYQQLAMATESVGWTGVTPLGAVDVYRGLLADVLGRRDEADARIAAGIELNDEIGARVWATAGRLLWAKQLAARGGAGAQRALQLFERARADAGALGAPALLAETEAVLFGSAAI